MWETKTFIFLLFGAVLAQGAVFETRLGKLEGLESTSRDGHLYYEFRGIPYAEKTERFQISQLVRPWSGVRKAVEFGSQCPQFSPLSKTIIGDEDKCLVLNIYTSIKMPSTEKVPVMVYIHSGCFEFGSGSEVDPGKYFMDEKVVLVTINYRLGALGFLSTLDGLIPENLGMRDQLNALHWIQQNIDAFAGDPSKVTLFGSSAGGASVAFHLLSPMSRGLFRNAISLSGSATSPWALQRDPTSNAKLLGKNLNCPTETSEKLVQCIRTKSSEEIVKAQMKFRKWFLFPFNTFAPVVEPAQSKYEKFLEDTPTHLLSLGKLNNLPWMTGFVEDEGAFLSPPIIMDEKLVTEINEDWNRILPIVLLYQHITDQGLKDNVSTKILSSYFGQEDIGEETWDSLTKLLSDRYFIHSIYKSAELHAKRAPVYAFEFTFPGGEYSPVLKTFFDIEGDYGVAHTDELQYLFQGFYGAPSHNNPNKQEAYELSKNFVKLFVSFARDNKPSATWKDALKWDPISTNGKSPIKFYQITSTTSLSDGGHKDRLALWDELDIDHFKSQNTEKLEMKDEL